ncbi:hypothetical protein VKT23_013940 [Stygiomarasmius scandens]|uniref:Uncharacterized protein n=1 Tax=Marasmiellus scandens TaxID=2682957 RepID=A0ABR1J690_9AGAR
MSKGKASADLSGIIPFVQSKQIPYQSYSPAKETEVRSQVYLRSSFEAGYKINGQDILRERRNQALEFASEALKRPELCGLITVQKEVYQKFPQETRLLEELMTNLKLFIVGDNQPTSFPVYSFSQTRFTALGFASDALAEQARHSCAITGKSLPGFPYWKIGSEVGRDFFNENDFEILAVAYRAQVEHFFMRLASIHDYATGRPVGQDKYLKSISTAKPKVQVRDVLDSISTAMRGARNRQFGSKSGQTQYRSGSTVLTRSSQSVRDLWSSEGEDNESDNQEENDQDGYTTPPTAPGGPPGDDPSDDDDFRGGGPRKGKGNSHAASKGPHVPSTFYTVHHSFTSTTAGLCEL